MCPSIPITFAKLFPVRGILRTIRRRAALQHLALFPDSAEASDLVYESFCDAWTIYDNRATVQQNIDEWDDHPWQ